MAQVTSADIRTRIKNMLLANTTISGFSPTFKVFDVAPMALQRANLPCIIIIDGNGTYDNTSLGERYIKPTASYDIVLFMQEWTAQTTLNIDPARIDAIHTAIEDTFTFYAPMIYNGSDLGVRYSRLTSFTRIQPRPYPQVQNAPVFVSRSWTLQVTYTRYVQNG